MQLTLNLIFFLTFFFKINYLCKYPPLPPKGQKFIFFRRKCPSCTQKSFCSTLPECTITLPKRISGSPPKTTTGPDCPLHSAGALESSNIYCQTAICNCRTELYTVSEPYCRTALYIVPEPYYRTALYTVLEP
ncbi:hypothetical protein AMTRI_Chr08g206270 [Amborella trichopoda]